MKLPLEKQVTSVEENDVFRIVHNHIHNALVRLNDYRKRIKNKGKFYDLIDNIELEAINSVTALLSRKVAEAIAQTKASARIDREKLCHILETNTMMENILDAACKSAELIKFGKEQKDEKEK